MIEEELISLIYRIRREKKKGQNLEVRKAHNSCPRLYDTLSSFSNQKEGGTIVLGIDETDGFILKGVYDAEDLVLKIKEQCRQMEPEIEAAFTTCETDSKTFVSVEVPPVSSMDRPVYYKGWGRRKGAYVRVGEKDEHMSGYEIYSYDSYRRGIHDDLRISDADFETLDKNRIQHYLFNVKENRPNIQDFSDEELMKLMGLLKDGKPTVTAVMCFSKYPQAFYPQLCITAVLVPGTEMGEETDDGRRFISNKKIEGTIEEMADAGVNFVRMNMKESVAFKEAKRIDIPEYPLEAVREAILNALVHRDYSIYTEGMPIRLEMYKDRLEITNPGGLYGAMDIDELGRVHADTRNKTLVSVLETMKVIENRYSGIPRIRRKMKELNLPDPEFRDRKGLFKVILYNGTGKEERETDEKENDLVEFCSVPRTREEIAKYLGKTQYYAMSRFVEPLVKEGLLAYTVPDKPKSSKQKFIKV